MFYHLILTDDCNLCCRYCRAKIFDFPEDGGKDVEIDSSMPSSLKFDLKQLYSFLSKDPDAVLTFYGGEPLLRMDLIREIMDNAPVKSFMIQTNGILLDKLGKDYLNRFNTILVSIDGSKVLTNHCRGTGVYERVIGNVKEITGNGFKGEIVARMTATERTNIFSAVKFLSRNKDFSFGSIHWQIDANFWGDYGKRREKFGKWMKENYNPGISKLIRLWVERMEKDGKVLKWYPFLDTTEDLLLGRKSKLRCGSGYANYTIMANGRIGPCPIMIGMKDYYAGHVSESNPVKLKKFSVGEPCVSCSEFDFCGGRCLYSNITKPWPEDGRKLVCKTVGHLHKELLKALPKIKKLLKEGKISLKDFEHLKFNGAEVIP